LYFRQWLRLKPTNGETPDATIFELIDMSTELVATRHTVISGAHDIRCGKLHAMTTERSAIRIVHGDIRSKLQSQISTIIDPTFF
jgi:hypothetical protein